MAPGRAREHAACSPCHHASSRRLRCRRCRTTVACWPERPHGLSIECMHQVDVAISPLGASSRLRVPEAGARASQCLLDLIGISRACETLDRGGVASEPDNECSGRLGVFWAASDHGRRTDWRHGTRHDVGRGGRKGVTSRGVKVLRASDALFSRATGHSIPPPSDTPPGAPRARRFPDTAARMARASTARRWCR